MCLVLRMQCPLCISRNKNFTLHLTFQEECNVQNTITGIEKNVLYVSILQFIFLQNNP